MDYHVKETLTMCGKGISLATIGATSQSLMVIGASLFWQVPLVMGGGYLTYSFAKQFTKYVKNEIKDYKKNKKE
ncbi:hypothetical protein NXG04_06855 [Klebsiella pneumoniae]|nr:hypothetical protein [Klebsiella pneumoniae]MDS7714288.1 hypothetical protein [Klebsiella pneumoniae]